MLKCHASGIGNTTLLEKYGFISEVDLLGVGENLQVCLVLFKILVYVNRTQLNHVRIIYHSSENFLFYALSHYLFSFPGVFRAKGGSRSIN